MTDIFTTAPNRGETDHGTKFHINFRQVNGINSLLVPLDKLGPSVFIHLTIIKIPTPELVTN